jgi:hypothetical protein
MCLALFMTTAYADPSPTVALGPDARLLLSPMDDQQPDTIFYDNDAESYNLYWTSQVTYWAYVRFLAPADFQLISLYFAAGYGGSGATACSVFVNLPGANNRPGTQLAAMATTVDIAGWYDLNLPDTVNITAGQQFLITIGPSDGYPQQPDGWYALLDATSTVNRSYLTTGNRVNGTYQQIPYDLHIRAGGIIASYVDLQAKECFNDTSTNHPAFNMLPGANVTLKAIVHNPTADPITDYTVSWSVVGPDGGDPIFTNETVGLVVNPNADRTVVATQALPVTTLGEYMVTCLANATDDANPANDTTYLRFFVGPQPRIFRYDDDGDPEGYVTYAPDNAKAILFRPVTYPAKITSVRVAVNNGEAAASVRIYRNNSVGQPNGNPVWTSTDDLGAGWNDITVSPPVNLTGVQTISVAYVFSASANGLGRDANPPNCAAISNMGHIAWQYDGAAWTFDDIGNWCIQAFVDTVGATAADPVHADMPSNYELSQNYPNPFNPSTDISFALPQAAKVTLAVYNTLGQEVAVLVNETLEAGRHTVTFKTGNLTAGVYLYRLTAGSDKSSYQAIRKMMLLK